MHCAAVTNWLGVSGGSAAPVRSAQTAMTQTQTIRKYMIELAFSAPRRSLYWRASLLQPEWLFESPHSLDRRARTHPRAGSSGVGADTRAARGLHRGLRGVS